MSIESKANCEARYN